MSSELFDYLAPAADDRPRHMPGVITAVVTDNNDEAELGRVLVKYPGLADTTISTWARVAVPMAGNAQGAQFLPEVGDEVLIAFEHGAADYPYILGALWNKQRMPPQPTADARKKSAIRSRSGMLICLDDSEGAEQIVISDQAGDNRVLINVAEKTITISAAADITLEAQGTLTLKGNSVAISAEADLKLTARSSMDAQANGPLKLKGSTIDLN